jgi:hypothetical protein
VIDAHARLLETFSSTSSSPRAERLGEDNVAFLSQKKATSEG